MKKKRCKTIDTNQYKFRDPKFTTPACDRQWMDGQTDMLIIAITVLAQLAKLMHKLILIKQSDSVS